MKPRNKFQQQIVELSKTLPKITDAQIKWGYKNCIGHIGHKSAKSVVTCLECSHSWTDNSTKEYSTCPHCNTKLQIIETRKRTFLDYEYLCIITAHKGFQVLRFLYIECKMKLGQKAHYFHSEVVQRWIVPNGKTAVLAKLRALFGFYDTWQFSTSLEIRPEKSLYNITPTEIYPRQTLIPEIKRSGYNKQKQSLFEKLTPFDILHYLLSENKAETLLKAGQDKLFKYFAYDRNRDINNYWISIRICLRNNYRIENVNEWCDYINLLRFFGKDLHNAKYVCPANLKAEHDKYVKKKREYIEKRKKEQTKQKALENEKLFEEMKSKFFGIQFSDGLIQVRVLESVEEIMQEGDAMRHCVFTNEYYLKPDSLILSACMDNKRLETIELSLSTLKILQCQGVCNQITEYHKQIINLVNKNIPLIQKRLAA